VIDKKFNELLYSYKEITVRYDTKNKALWYYFNPSQRPCYTMEMIREIHHFQLAVIDYFKFYKMKPKTPINYIVMASQSDGVFNYGGDLNFFAQLIRKKDRKGLFEYAKACIDILYLQSQNLKLPITTISLVEGSALGGGFEAALSSDILITQKDVKIGLPEIRFNLFPGMGAYSFLARIIGVKETEELMTSGKIYSSQEIYEKGLITILAEPYEAKKALDKFIEEDSKFLNGMQAIRSSRRIYKNIDYLELLDITKVWVDAALNLDHKDLKVMYQLTKTQKIKGAQTKQRTKQDRRIQNNMLSFPILDHAQNSVTYDRRLIMDRRA